MSDPLLTVKQAAERLGLRPSTVYQLSYERRIATVKLGRAVRVRESVLEAFIRKHERPALRAGLDG